MFQRRGTRRASARQMAIVLVLLFAVLLDTGGGDLLDDLILRAEEVVDSLAESATDAYKNRELHLGECECSYHACGSKFSEAFGCSKLLDAPEFCDCHSRLIDLTSSFVRTPPGTDPMDISDEVKESLCTYQCWSNHRIAELSVVVYMYKVLDKEFSRHFNTSMASMYIATPDGATRVFPGQPAPRGIQGGDAAFGDCEQFDPRWRPWYTQAISGPKDVVIVLDTSGSMLDLLDLVTFRTRWSVVRDATVQLLDTFGIGDFVGIVGFSDKTTVFEPKFAEATSGNIDSWKKAVQGIEPLGGTDFRLGLDSAFELLIDAAAADEDDEDENKKSHTSNCEKVIIFLTDGEDCTVEDPQQCAFGSSDKKHPGAGPSDLVLDFIEGKQQELEATGSKRATVVTYSLGYDADDKVPKQMACTNGGSWSSIQGSDDAVMKMLGYIEFLASGRGQVFADRRGVIWSHYEDASGFGEVVTASKPIYTPGLSDYVNGSLVAVVGHDLPLQALGDELEYSQIVGRVAKASRRCVEWDASACQLQLLRGEESECPETFDAEHCYYFEDVDRYYLSPENEALPFPDAEKYCASLGGSLAILDSKDKIQFGSGLASASGSWINLMRSGSTWTWSGKETVEDKDGEFWAVGADPTGLYDCGAIDNRGVRNNVFPKKCEEDARFVCEFSNPPSQCSGPNLVKVTDAYNYNVPPISQCESPETTKRPPLLATLASDEVLCELGQQNTTEEIQCCHECKFA